MIYPFSFLLLFFFKDTATTEIYTLSLHDALPISEPDIKAWDIAILPDGTGLPAGSGTAMQGAPIYAQKCAICHGDNGVNPRPGYVPMVSPPKFDRIDAPKTV